jgi:anti-anti-sigma factor
VPSDWNDDISVCELSDEPQLSEELSSVIDRAEKSAPGSRAAKHTVLNFSGVRYISSSHLAQLIRLRKALGDAGKQLLLCSVNDNLWSVFLMSGLDRVFRFAPDPLTALATLQLEIAPDEGQEQV